MALTKHYRKKPEFVEAVHVTKDNLEEVARWCGGRAFGEAKASDPTDVYVGVYLPTMEGPVAVGTDAYIFRDSFDGSFKVLGEAEFEREYQLSTRDGSPVPPISKPPVPDPVPYAHYDEH